MLISPYPVLPPLKSSLALVNNMRQPTVVVRGPILSSWLTVSDYTKSQLARELGVSRGRISQLLTSREEPSAHLIAKLLLLTRLPFHRLFMVTGEERPAQPGVREGTTNHKDKRGGAGRKRA